MLTALQYWSRYHGLLAMLTGTSPGRASLYSGELSGDSQLVIRKNNQFTKSRRLSFAMRQRVGLECHVGNDGTLRKSDLSPWIRPCSCAMGVRLAGEDIRTRCASCSRVGPWTSRQTHSRSECRRRCSIVMLFSAGVSVSSTLARAVVASDQSEPPSVREAVRDPCDPATRSSNSALTSALTTPHL